MHAQQTNLPPAPSTLLAQQAEALTAPAGSNYTFHAPSTMQGPGGLTIELPQSGPLSLSLDDAIALGLARNVRLKYDRANQLSVHGDQRQVINALLPSLTASASTGTQEINLAAMGFKPSLLAGAHLLPAGFTFSTIVKVDTTQAQLAASQQLFNLSAYELYQGAKHESTVVDLNYLNSRGDLVLSVGTAYLKVLADQSTVLNAEAEELTAKTTFSQASDRQQAGVGTHLDSLRAQVDYQQHQQRRRLRRKRSWRRTPFSSTASWGCPRSSSCNLLILNRLRSLRCSIWKRRRLPPTAIARTF